MKNEHAQPSHCLPLRSFLVIPAMRKRIMCLPHPKAEIIMRIAEIVWEVPTQNKVIALTFDDGRMSGIPFKFWIF